MRRKPKPQKLKPQKPKSVKPQPTSSKITAKDVALTSGKFVVGVLAVQGLLHMITDHMISRPPKMKT